MCTSIAQVIIVQFGGAVMATKPIDGIQWASCVLLGLTILPFGALMRVLVPVPEYDWLKYKKLKNEKSQV